jgi:hypothetical protein
MLCTPPIPVGAWLAREDGLKITPNTPRQTASFKSPDFHFFNCASLEPRANIKMNTQLHRNKISINPPIRVFLSIFFDCLPSSSPEVRVEGMKTSHTLIQLRQHRSLCLVSARLPG